MIVLARLLARAEDLGHLIVGWTCSVIAVWIAVAIAFGWFS